MCFLVLSLHSNEGLMKTVKILYKNASRIWIRHVTAMLTRLVLYSVTEIYLWDLISFLTFVEALFIEPKHKIRGMLRKVFCKIQSKHILYYSHFAAVMLQLQQYNFYFVSITAYYTFFVQIYISYNLSLR